MCDCPRERDDESAVETIGPETVTIFSKCVASYHLEEDVIELAAAAVTDDTGWLPIYAVRSDSGDTSSDSTAKLCACTELSGESVCRRRETLRILLLVY